MLRGVKSVTPGYAGGGDKEAPTYHGVSMGKTNHVEVIKVDFDPNQISCKDLLSVFFGTHDPTTPGRQGNDVGEQYRSIVLYTSNKQREEAEQYIRSLNESSKKGKHIVTEIKPLDKFYEAEDRHKDYYKNNQNSMYCNLVINPKLKKAQEEFAELLKKPASS